MVTPHVLCGCLQVLCKDGRFLPGAGATEIELAHRIHSLAESTPGLEQYALAKVMRRR